MITESRITNDQIDLAFTKLEKELSKEEVFDAAVELEKSETFGRSRGSAEFLLARMHILVHGIAPEGETERRAETMFTISENLIQWANDRGLDTDFNIEYAREELKNRPVRIKYDDAKALLSEHYFANKTDLPKTISNYRKEILELIMNGTPASEAFAQFS
jgi:hypothetical protein